MLRCLGNLRRYLQTQTQPVKSYTDWAARQQASSLSNTTPMFQCMASLISITLAFQSWLNGADYRFEIIIKMVKVILS